MLKQVDKLIKEGKISDARRLQRQILREPYAREDVAVMASYLRRLGEMAKAIKILHPFVFPQLQNEAPLNNDELIEYAANISRLGGSKEALRILKKIDIEKNPEAHFGYAFAYYADWRQDLAISHFKTYIEHPNTDSYKKLVCSINLIACYTFMEDWNRAHAEIKRVRPILEKEKFLLLLANTYDLEGQICYFNNDLSTSEESLNKAKAIFSDSGISDALYIEKWISLICFRKQKHQNSSELETIFVKAKKINHYETMRDLDLQMGLILKDERLVARAYFGSIGYEMLRRKIKNLANKKSIKIPKEFIFPDHLEQVGSKELFNCKSGIYKDMHLKNGQLLHRLNLTLVSDLYRPVPLAALHDKLFPDRYYNIYSSPAVIAMLISRLRKWFSDSRIITDIVVDKGSCFLKPGKTAFLVTDDTENKLPSLSLQKPYAQMTSVFKNGIFQKKEVRNILNVSPRSTNRILAGLVKEGFLESIDSGNKTRYFCKQLF